MKHKALEELARVDQEVERLFRKISQDVGERSQPLDAVAAYELHRSLWAGLAGAEVVQVECNK